MPVLLPLYGQWQEKTVGKGCCHLPDPVGRKGILPCDFFADILTKSYTVLYHKSGIVSAFWIIHGWFHPVKREAFYAE